MRKILEFVDRICSSCKQRKPMEEFPSKRNEVGGRSYLCKPCAVKDVRARQKRTKPQRARYQLAYVRERKRIDASFRKRLSLRNSLNKAVAQTNKMPMILELIDVASTAELRAHLQYQFEPGMTWENYGRGGWEVDHIVPLSKFDLTKHDEQKLAFALSNLRPRWWKKNRSTKGNSAREGVVSHT